MYMEYKPEITVRLNRIEGQLKGVQKMVANERDCLAIVQQLKALQSAIHSVNQQLIKQYLLACLGSDPLSIDDPEKLSRLLNLIEK